MATRNKRAWKDEFVKYGFTKVVEKGIVKAQCINCNSILANESLRPFKLKTHFNNIHGGKGTEEEMKVKRARFDQKGSLTGFGFVKHEKPVLEASYEVAYLIAREKASFSSGEKLIKRGALKMAQLVLGEEAMKKLKDIPLSNDVVTSRINEMSDDVLTQVVSGIKNSPVRVSLQLDESTDVSNMSHLLVFVRYVEEATLRDEFLFCAKLELTTKAIDVFGLLSDFLRTHGIDWNKIGSICTDGAPSMLGYKSGFVGLAKSVVPDIITIHCVLHRQALASKTLPDSLKEVLSTVVHVVNFIRGRALQHRIFKAFCEEVGAEHTVLLFHTEVRWLSRGRVLDRVVNLSNEIAVFLRDTGHKAADKFENEEFLFMLCYLADIFGHLNDLNLSLQGSNANRILCFQKVQAFMNKLPLWKKRIAKGNTANFKLLDLKLNDADASAALIQNITEHLSDLEIKFAHYLGEKPMFFSWIEQPFFAKIDEDDELADEIIDLQSNSGAKTIFEANELPDFWLRQMIAYPHLARVALHEMLPFPTIYLCEQGFSILAVLKTKWRNRLDPSNQMRLTLSKLEPRVKQLMDKKQEQRSH